jgi:tetratricopeptide (TPR) repeat protein
MSTVAYVRSIPPAKLSLFSTLFAFIASLAVYSLTLAPTVTLVDSGELIVTAKSLGVAHPPGFPLYVTLAHLATLIPIGSIASRVNFASAIFAAVAAGITTAVVYQALLNKLKLITAKNSTRIERGKKPKKSATAVESADISASPDKAALIVSGLIPGLFLAFSRTLWAYATIAEVYTLNALLILLIFLLIFRWRCRFIDGIAPKKPVSRQGSAKSSATVEPVRTGATDQTRLSSDDFLYGAAFLFGLSLGVHHVTVVLMLPALAILVFKTQGVGFFLSRRLLYAALFALAGLIIVYAYLPIAASRSPLMNWGDPRTLQRLLWQVTGKQYQVFISFSLQSMISQFGEFIKIAANEFGPWWLPVGLALAIAGIRALFREDRAMFWFLILAIAADLVYSLGYDIAEDKDAYYLPTFIALAIAMGFGVEWLIGKARAGEIAGKPAASVIVLVLCFTPILGLAGNWSYDNRSRYYIAHDYVENIFSTIDPGGMLLTRDWQVYSPMLYTSLIERYRNDAVVVDINQLRRSWYYDYLQKVYPSTIDKARDKVDAFLEDLRHWEQDPDLYQRDITLNQRINSRFFEMILAFISNHLQTAPVYVTLDIAGNREGQDSELTKSLISTHQLVPQGLVFQVTNDREFKQPTDLHMNTRGLADGTIKFGNDDVVTLKVFPVYVNMFYNRGRYLAVNGRHDQAIEAFKQALALNPGFALAQQALNESTVAVGRGASGKPQ